MDGARTASTPLSPQQKRRASALLDELLDLPAARRLARLGDYRGEDPPVLAEVASLLHAIEASGGFLTEPARAVRDDAQLDTTLGMQLGAWRLTRLIGRGGMGDVYEGARVDGEFEQRVAIKLLQRDTAADAKRFQAERRMLAGLQHPGIARLYDGGVTHDGRLYMVMEYIEGCSITEYCLSHKPTLAQRLALFRQICAAVAHAHARRVIHRDLKPSNILVTAAGDVKLLDFGIARVLDAQVARVTHASGVPLSPICAAPEQLTGAPTTPATDVYALGLLLYELLTGSHPWMGVDTPMLQAMRVVLERPAPLASRASRPQAPAPVPQQQLRGDLDAIIAKALRKEPGQRYQSVADLQADIARFERGEPVAARARARWYPLTHFLYRGRWLAVGVAAALAVVLVGWQLSARRVTADVGGHSVALMEFGNLSGQQSDSWLSAALTEMFGTDLSDTASLRVLPADLVRDVMRGLHSGGAGSFSPEALLHLGQVLGADYIVSGNYLVAPTASSPSLRVDVAIQEVRSGQLLARFSRQAGLTNLSDLERQVGAVLRIKLGVPAGGDATLAQLALAQPPSLDVARLTGIAAEAMQHYDAARARDALLQIIAEAPGFAPAYASLSEAWSALGYRERAVASGEQAVAHAASLSAEAQLHIDAVLQGAKSQWRAAQTDWQKLVALRPSNPEYRLHAIDAALSAGDARMAQAQLVVLRSLPGEVRDPRVELAAARIQGFLDDSKAAAAHAQAALDLATAIPAPGLVADARAEFAGAHMHLGDFDAAAASLRAAIHDYQVIDNPRGEANATRNLAMVQADQHQVDAARAQYERAMMIDQGIGDSAGVSAVYRDLAEMLWDSGDRDGAQTAARRALEISRETADLKLQAWSLRALATIASDESASDSVMNDYEAVTALTQQSGDRGGHVWSLTAYADVARMRGDMPRARKACAQALTEAPQLTDPQFTVFATFTCALVEVDGGAPGKAAEMLRQVQQRAPNSDGGIYHANAGLVLAQIDQDGGHCAQAIEQLDRVIGEFKAAQLPAGEADAEAMRALCQQRVGNAAARDAALARALQLRRSITSRQEVYFVDIVAAQLGGAPGAQQGSVDHLAALAADAEQRHWLTWALEAKLAAWEYAVAHGDPLRAARLRAELQSAATAHGMGRILARLKQRSA